MVTRRYREQASRTLVLLMWAGLLLYVGALGLTVVKGCLKGGMYEEDKEVKDTQSGHAGCH
jgi:putative hemolysin